ncbi:MAG: PAS domain-containing protein [Ignavibacteria bacterium]|nr:PAS domain-containing protein [Ignavibacteria bacterium]
MISAGSSDCNNGITLDNLFSFLPGMAYRCANDTNWTMFIISPGSFELTGYTPDEFINQFVSYDSLILPEYRQKVWDAIQEAINTTLPFTIEYRICTKSGEEKWVWEKGAGIYNEEGNLLFLEGYITDITEKKEREFEFNTFFDIQPDLLCIATIGGTLIRVNKAWEKTLGFGVEELQGRSFIEFVHPDDLEKTLNISTYISDDGIISSFRNRYLTKTGEVVTLDWRAAIKNDKYYAVARDVSQQIKLQESVKENAGVLKSLVNSITESAILIELDGTVVISNLITAERLKRPGEDLSGKNIFELLEPETAEYRRKKIDEVIRTKASVQFEDLRFGSNILNSFYPVFDENGDVYRLAIFGFDITERKDSIRELEALSSELRDLNERKNKFISILAHDLRGPFHPLLNSLDLLYSDYELFTEEERKQFIKSSYEIAQTQFALLESILEWSRATQGKLRINAERFLISTIIQKAIAQMATVYESKNILIKFTPSEEFFAIADTEMTLTVVRNLLSNAAKFSDAGAQVWINQKATDKTIEVSVIDNGRGIETESLNKLFDISHTRSSRGTFNEKGSGLGLLLCKELLEKMHGTIVISSELGMGTIVTFTLPRGLSI